MPRYGIKGFIRGALVAGLSHAIILLDVCVLSKDSLAPYHLVLWDFEQNTAVENGW